MSDKDIIYRQDAIDAVNAYLGLSAVSRTIQNMTSIQEILEKLPSAEPERKKGKWIDTGSGQECSECHEIQYGYDSFRYFCAFCGADMRGIKE